MLERSVQLLCWIVKELVQGAHGVLLMDSVDDVCVYGNTNELSQMAGGEVVHLTDKGDSATVVSYVAK